ncbi:MAG: helix-turn-helix domain-containing protein [Mangrovicoccus sp.]|nr:helix-turn-helix domain-containing protein [Mangrovicoccus sp.]
MTNIVKSRDWAQLSRDFRIAKGLKQAAMAQDFLVNQSTVSRWESGRREPPAHVKSILLKEFNTSEPRQANALDAALIGIWDRAGQLCSLSCGLLAKLRGATGDRDLSRRSAAELLLHQPLLRRAFQLLRERGLFEGHLPNALLSSAPFWDRPRHQGTLTLALSPMRLGSETALLAACNYVPRQSGPRQPSLAIIAPDARDGLGIDHYSLA